MRRRTEIVAGLVLAVSVICAVKVMAEEPAINPVRVTTRQLNVYGTNPLQIHGTNVSVSAAEINAAGGGSTAALTPATVVASTSVTAPLMTASKTFVTTPETLTLTKGAFTLTPTQALYYIAGQYGVVTMTLANATYSGMPLTFINTVATNVVLEDGTANLATMPDGYGSWTNGQYDGMTYVSWGTNWLFKSTHVGN